jgi:hypothetical protein
MDEILQEVAIVARSLYNETPVIQTEPRDHLVTVILSVSEPGVGVRRKIRVVAEDILGALVLFQLDQKTLIANVNVQRVVDLAPIQVSARWVGLAERRHTQVDKGLPEPGATKATGGDCG